MRRFNLLGTSVAALCAGLLTAGVATSSATVPMAPSLTPVGSLAAATTVPAGPRYLSVAISKGLVTMPSRILAGTYYVHVKTADLGAGLQVVRPPQGNPGYTPTKFYAAWTAFHAHADGPGAATTFRSWRTAVTFIGGAQVAPHTQLGFARTPAGVGTFAITLSAGTYWFYADSGNGDPYTQWIPGKSLVANPRLVRVVTVVGALPSQRPVPVAALARFGIYPVRAGSVPAIGNVTSVSLPAHLPTAGFIKGLGTPGRISALWVKQLKPGITDADLRGDYTCFGREGLDPPVKDCFVANTFRVLGGGVSAGASALWYYVLPPGEYVMGNGGHDENYRFLFSQGLVSRVTVS